MVQSVEEAPMPDDHCQQPSVWQDKERGAGQEEMGEASQLTETWRGQKRDEVGMGDKGDSGIPLNSRLNKGVDEDIKDEGGETGDNL
uniref:Uncharacterized protein n=1 Tax=Oryza meridionalis TaxID=40149 RepID=A0A0E0FAQ9_9ORYZ